MTTRFICPLAVGATMAEPIEPFPIAHFAARHAAVEAAA